VESREVWCSISELSLAPNRTTMVESHIHIINPATPHIADDATRQDAACFYFSIIASAAAIRSSSGSLMQCSVSLALSDNSFWTSITAGSCSGK
jgi:hypothetical protein